MRGRRQQLILALVVWAVAALLPEWWPVLFLRTLAAATAAVVVLWTPADLRRWWWILPLATGMSLGLHLLYENGTIGLGTVLVLAAAGLVAAWRSRGAMISRA